MINDGIVIIGYSGHAFVVIDILRSTNKKVIGYCDISEKRLNPYELKYLGKENSEPALKLISQYTYFTAIGDNTLRFSINKKITSATQKKPSLAIDQSSFISPSAKIDAGVMVGGGARINALSEINEGVICNTHCVVEHECFIGPYCHIAPGAVLCGNVSVGEFTFIGARSIIKQGINIGKNVIVGAGSVIINDIPDNSKVVGNPQRKI